MSEDLDRKIRYFLCISMHGSISAASEQLNISQPSLSRQLASLESYLGNPLFRRTGRGLVLTDAGTHLASMAGPAFMAVDSAISKIKDEFGITRGHLRLATVHTLTYYFLGDLVSRFVHQNRDVNVSFMARSSTEVIKLVESGRADLGFVYDSEVASMELLSSVLFTESMAIVVRAGGEPAPQILDLTREALRLVVFPSGYALRRMLDTCSVPFTIAAEVETVDAMLELVSSGVGACILPSLIPDRVLQQYNLTRITDIRPALNRKVVAIYRADPPPTAITKAILGFATLAANALK
ncbi:LysR family transcriptional regulator [Pseudomonas sp. REP124]|uniref:LysR family transcriptional regulator n=1 Tax=Pseudomonas sp. REP124 TaxID=2875731 RepID=UPI001CCA386A|nr:LysR family transcriptional regulator [Pseudomonas sp. REP124]MBZ9781493.1 LysR family transcriptional regulator [Pseudomonas sp. REP124]